MKDTVYLVLDIEIDIKTNRLHACYIANGDPSWLFMESKEDALAVCKDIAECNFKDLQEEPHGELVRMEKVEDGYNIVDEYEGIIEMYKPYPIVIEH